jgi:NitT/TauT family transport system substrate-binding protein
MKQQHSSNSTPRRLSASVLSVAVAIVVFASLGAGAASSAVSTRAAGVSTAGPAAPHAKQLKTIHFAIVSPQIQPAIMNHWIGKYLGYFSQEGIDADIQTSAGAAATLQELLSGQLDVAIGTLETLYAAANQNIDLPLKLYYQYQMVSAYQWAVDPSSSIKTVNDLKTMPKPIKIGIISTAETGYYYARALVAKLHLNPDKDVQWVALGQGPAAIDAVKNHTVDLFSAFTSLYAIWHTQGYDVRRIAQPDKRIASIGNAFLMAKDKDLGDPTMQKYLVGYARAVAKATIFAIANPNAACRIHFEMYPATLSPSVSYLQNIQNCLYIWNDRSWQYDARKAGLKYWGGPINGDQLAVYSAILGYGAGIDTDSLFTNYLLPKINKGLNAAAVIKQAKHFCKQAKNKSLCTKTSYDE